MARSTSIWLAWEDLGSGGSILLGAYTVKHEMMSQVGLTELTPINSRGWYNTDRQSVNVQRVRDGVLREGARPQ